MANTKTKFKQAVQEDMNAIGAKVAQNSCVFQIKFGGCTFTKKIPSEFALSTLDKEGKAKVQAHTLRISQDMINKDHLEGIWKAGRDFVAEVKRLSVPGFGFVLGGGQYLIPLDSIEEVKEKLETMVTERNEALEAFLDDYESIIDEARDMNGEFFNEVDYPSAQKVRDSYNLDYRFIGNQVPEELKKVSNQLYEIEKARIEAECAAAVPKIREALRASFLGLVEHISNSMLPDPDTGKKKRFYGSSVDKLKDFIDLFATKDLTGDSDLQTIIQKTNAILSDSDVDLARTDEEFRQQLGEKFKALSDDARLLVPEDVRRIDLD